MFIPHHMLEAMARSSDRRTRKLALHHLAAADRARAARATLAKAGSRRIVGKEFRLVRDAGKRPNLNGEVRRQEGDPRTGDRDVDDAFRHSGIVLEFYRRIFNRLSVDDRGMPLASSVRYRLTPTKPLLGARWDRNRRAMAYGEAFEGILKRPAKALDVAGHEITHGVVEFTAGLAYEGEPGALDESFADVMGSLVKQWHKGQTARQADWLIGDEIVLKSKTVHAIRSLKAPGSAYSDVPDMGSDEQVWHMKDKYTGSKDDAGVHINSGIPNHVFYLCAVEIGGKAWERVGQVWYDTLRQLRSNSDFEDCAKTTYVVAGARYGRGSGVQKAVRSAWKTVGLSI